jgi:hypothetical protein
MLRRVMISVGVVVAAVVILVIVVAVSWDSKSQGRADRDNLRGSRAVRRPDAFQSVG